METKFQSPEAACGAQLSLQQLINNLVRSSLPVANRNNTQLVNDIRQEIALGTSTQSVIAIMTDLLSTVINNSQNGEIHITAERFKDTVLLEIQERNNNNGYALAFSIGAIEPKAASLGGYIKINGPQKRVATISFSFPDQFAA